MTNPTPAAPAPTTDPTPGVDAEVVRVCQELIRIDTSNYGDDTGPGERAAAEYVAERLAAAGLDPQILESAPRRSTVVARWDGADSGAAPVLVHGHLDVVPAQAADWQVDPFGGELRDGCVWGRGAVDMKDFDAMVLSVLAARAATGRPPRRPVVLAFTADEEAGGRQGAHWLVDHHADKLAGCTEAIGEVGGFSVSVGDRQAYLIQTAEKGMAWMRLRAAGRAGHGSLVNTDNAVTELAAAIARLGAHRWPVQLTATTERLLRALCAAAGSPFEPTADGVAAVVRALGPAAAMIGATVRNTTNPTMLQAGYKVNVIPGEAVGYVDGRFLPGGEEEFFATVDELLGPDVAREVVNTDIALETGFDGALVDAIGQALRAEDPAAATLPYLMPGGTDGKAWSRLGVRCFGFTPLRLPPDLNFFGMFHGVDERVPVDALRFGARVLDRFLDLA